MSTNSLKMFHPVKADGLKRMGNVYDGGYIVHHPSLKDVDYLINYGVGYNVEFEKDFFRTTGSPTLAFDPTLTDIAPIIEKLRNGEFMRFVWHVKNYGSWIFKKKKLPKYRIELIDEGIADKDHGKYKSLAYHFSKYDLYDKKIILKIDVEGAEFQVLNDPAVYKLLNNAVQIIVEFHELSKHIENLKHIIQTISKTHSLIHIHSNNNAGTFDYENKKVPELIEVTFLLNEYLDNKGYNTSSYPVAGLDQPCDKNKEDIILDFFY